MRYPVFIYGNERIGYAVTVPDITGATYGFRSFELIKPSLKDLVGFALDAFEEERGYIPIARNITHHVMNHEQSEDSFITWVEVEG